MAIESRFFGRQHREHRLLRRVAITTILDSPIRSPQGFLEIVCHGMGALSTELRRALVVGKIGFGDAKVEIGGGARCVLNLTFERI